MLITLQASHTLVRSHVDLRGQASGWTVGELPRFNGLLCWWRRLNTQMSTKSWPLLPKFQHSHGIQCFGIHPEKLRMRSASLTGFGVRPAQKHQVDIESRWIEEAYENPSTWTMERPRRELLAGLENFPRPLARGRDSVR